VSRSTEACCETWAGCVFILCDRLDEGKRHYVMQRWLTPIVGEMNFLQNTALQDRAACIETDLLPVELLRAPNQHSKRLARIMKLTWHVG
jgi:hypothetical protein